MQLDRRLSFGEDLQITTAKAIQCGAAVTWLMPNIGGPSGAKKRLVTSVVNSKLLYAAPIWISAINNHAILKKLFSAQKGLVLRIVSAYRTVSTSAVLVMVSQNCRKSLTRRRPSASMEGADSSRHGRRDGMETNPGDGHTVIPSYLLNPELATWLDRKHSRLLTWHRCFRAMVALRLLYRDSVSHIKA